MPLHIRFVLVLWYLVGWCFGTKRLTIQENIYTWASDNSAPLSSLFNARLAQATIGWRKCQQCGCKYECRSPLFELKLPVDYIRTERSDNGGEPTTTRFAANVRVRLCGNCHGYLSPLVKRIQIRQPVNSIPLVQFTGEPDILGTKKSLGALPSHVPDDIKIAAAKAIVDANELNLDLNGSDSRLWEIANS
jgi:hypothetical protein